MSIEQHPEIKHLRKSAQVLKALALGVGLVPFVLATLHHAPAAVVAQVDQALMTVPETADGGDPQALGQSTDRVQRWTGSHPRGPKVPPGQ
jgi:hypothetical protein